MITIEITSRMAHNHIPDKLLQKLGGEWFYFASFYKRVFQIIVNFFKILKPWLDNMPYLWVIGKKDEKNMHMNNVRQWSFYEWTSQAMYTMTLLHTGTKSLGLVLHGAQTVFTDANRP